MRSFKDISCLQKLNAILQSHDFKIMDDGRMFAVVHTPPGGQASVSRHRSLEAVVEALEPLDTRITKILQPCA